MWIAVIFFAIVAILVAGSIWEARRKRVRYGLRTGRTSVAGSIGPDTGSVFGHAHGSYGGAGPPSYGDCGSGGGDFGGGGGDSGGSC